MRIANLIRMSRQNNEDGGGRGVTFCCDCLKRLTYPSGKLSSSRSIRANQISSRVAEPVGNNECFSPSSQLSPAYCCHLFLHKGQRLVRSYVIRLNTNHFNPNFEKDPQDFPFTRFCLYRISAMVDAERGPFISHKFILIVILIKLLTKRVQHFLFFHFPFPFTTTIQCLFVLLNELLLRRRRERLNHSHTIRVFLFSN